MITEEEISKIVTNNPEMLVPWYLILSYLYYNKDISLVSDGFYDELCSCLLAQYDELKHRHKNLIQKDSLQAGTGFDLTYPTIVELIAEELATL